MIIFKCYNLVEYNYIQLSAVFSVFTALICAIVNAVAHVGLYM